MKAKTLATFEEAHGQPKIRRMERELAAERAKVAALADVQGKVRHVSHKGNIVRFGLFGDTQTGSIYSAPECWAAWARYAKERGCATLYHTGDVLDGHRVYKGQEFEVRDVGMAAQLDRLAKDAPDVGLPVEFIVGNHDLSLKALAGIDIGRAIEHRMEDAGQSWRFLGEDAATVEIATPCGKTIRLMLLHPGGGSAYSLSYRPQKMIESLEGGTKPDILAIGHYHKAEMLPNYRNVCAFQSGCFQWQSPFMVRQSLAAHVGGWIVEAVAGKDLLSVRGEFVAFYR
jgi:hypothetical protein